VFLGGGYAFKNRFMGSGWCNPINQKKQGLKSPYFG